MSTDTPKLKFDFNYWIGQLIEAGKKLDPAKYTPEYEVMLVREWAKQPITKLHQRVLKRKQDIVNKQHTI